MRALSELFPPFVACAAHDEATSPPAASLSPFPEEHAHIARAVEKRRAEYLLGRSCARRAMAALGVAPVALPSLPDRSVAWPAEIWGSITHTEGLCAAVAARRSDVVGIGLDVEVRGRVLPHLWKSVATPTEIAWFEAAGQAEQGAERATRLFSAKEAFYKAQYCVTRAWVGFHDVELSFDDRGGFTVELCVDVAKGFERGRRIPGRETLLPRHVASAVWLSP